MGALVEMVKFLMTNLKNYMKLSILEISHKLKINGSVIKENFKMIRNMVKVELILQMVSISKEYLTMI
jgi:hypothetical protein